LVVTWRVLGKGKRGVALSWRMLELQGCTEYKIYRNIQLHKYPVLFSCIHSKPFTFFFFLYKNRTLKRTFVWGGVEMRSRTGVSVGGGENTTSIRRNMGNLPATFRQVKTYKIRLLIMHVLLLS
jgi:hypothetical protein